MLFVLWAIAMNDQFPATLRKVRELMEMIASISASLVGLFETFPGHTACSAGGRRRDLVRGEGGRRPAAHGSLATGSPDRA